MGLPEDHTTLHISAQQLESHLKDCTTLPIHCTTFEIFSPQHYLDTIQHVESHLRPHNIAHTPH